MDETDDPNHRPQKAGTKLDRVGDTLRRVYDEAATEPLPQAFEDLLRQLQ